MNIEYTAAIPLQLQKRRTANARCIHTQKPFNLVFTYQHTRYCAHPGKPALMPAAGDRSRFDGKSFRGSRNASDQKINRITLHKNIYMFHHSKRIRHLMMVMRSIKPCLSLLVLILAMPVLRAQTAKDYYELGLAEEKKAGLYKYEKAMPYYYKAWDKATIVNRKMGDDALRRFWVQYDQAMADLFDKIDNTSIDNFTQIESYFNEAMEKFKGFKEQYSRLAIEPPASSVNHYLKSLCEYNYNKLKSNSAASFEDYFNFFDVAFPEKVSELRGYYSQINSNKIGLDADYYKKWEAATSLKACEKFSNEMKRAFDLFAQNKFKEAHGVANQITPFADGYGCDTKAAQDFMAQCVTLGQKKMVMLPLRNYNRNNSCLSASFVSDAIGTFNASGNLFVKALPLEDLETKLLEAQILMEELQKLNPIQVSKLGKALKVNYLLILELTRLEEQQPQITRTPKKAYFIEQYQQYNSYKNKYETKYCAEREQTYYHVQGKKRWELDVSMKLMDISGKNPVVLQSKPLEYSFDSKIDYYEGIDNLGNYSNKYISRSLGKTYRPRAEASWTAKFKTQSFATSDKVCNAAEVYFRNEIINAITGNI